MPPNRHRTTPLRAGARRAWQVQQSRASPPLDLRQRDPPSTPRPSEIACVKALHGADLPWIVESPETSLLWFVPYFAMIVEDPIVRVVKADQCRFGKAWKKRTRFIFGNIDDDDLPRPSKTGCGTRGDCPHTDSGRHFQLQVASPSGQLWTRLAAAYPTRMASDIAHALTAQDLGRLVNECWKY